MAAELKTCPNCGAEYPDQEVAVIRCLLCGAPMKAES